ncbi:MAG: NHL repeat-containing protein, partial [Chloroflexi bacterium]|nr:NHL repeat-containing protein [Chloroflexota bacterium]
MKAGREMIERWRGEPATRWPALALLATTAASSVALALLWYPPPALALPQRLLAALLLTSLLLAGGTRLTRWLRADPERPVDRANLIALAVLAGGSLVLMVVGGPLLAALQRAVPGLVLLLGLVVGGIAGVALLGLAARDLATLTPVENLTAPVDASVIVAEPVAVGAGVPEVTTSVAAAEDVAHAVPVAVAPVPTAVIPARTPVVRRSPWAWLDSKWTMAVLVALLLLAGGNYLARQGYLGGLTALLPTDGPAGPEQPAAKDAPAVSAPGAAMPITDITAQEVRPLLGEAVAGAKPLDDARSLVASADGRLYIVETGTKQVIVLDNQGKEVRRWGGPGQGDGQFEEPVAVAVDPTGNVHVLDAQRNSVQVFSTEGRFLSTYGGGQTSYRPRGLAMGDDSSLYMADTGRNRVLRLSETGEQEGILPPNWEARPAAIDQPTAAISAAGVVYIAEPTRARLHRLTSDGTPVAPAWAIAGSDTLRSARLTLGPKAEVVVAEVGAGRVLLICPGGDKVLAWKL